MKNTIITTALAGIVTAGALGSVQVYGEIEVLKEQVRLAQKDIADRNKNNEQFEVFLTQMDKSLAIQTEAVNGIKRAVDRLENAVFTLKGKEPAQ